MQSVVPKLNQIIANDSEKDFYNMDETGLLYRGLPHKTLSSPSEKCKDENVQIKD